MQLFDQEASSCSPSTAFRGVRTVPTLCAARCFLWDLVCVGERACCHMKMIYPSVNTSILTVIAHRTSICHRSCTLLTLAPGSMLWECDKLPDIVYDHPLPPPPTPRLFLLLFFHLFLICFHVSAKMQWMYDPFSCVWLHFFIFYFFSFVFICFMLLNNKCTINHWQLQGINCALVHARTHTTSHTHTLTHTHTHTRKNKKAHKNSNNKSKHTYTPPPPLVCEYPLFLFLFVTTVLQHSYVCVWSVMY